MGLRLLKFLLASLVAIVFRLMSLVRRLDLAINSLQRANVALQVIAAFEMALIFTLWPMWWSVSDFPVVPLFSINVPFANTLAKICLVSVGILIWKLTGEFNPAKLTRAVAVVALLSACGLVVSDQHWLQAWHWLFILNLCWWLFLRGVDRLTVMRHTIATVYVCSALSRIISEPGDGIAGVIVGQIASIVGLRSLVEGSDSLNLFCHVMTVGEFLVGLLLLLPRFRRVGCMAAVALHITLLVVLGPWGLNHHAGVLLWNLCFIVLVPVLFWGSDANAHEPDTRQKTRLRAFIAMVWLFPLSGLLALADNWPSWQLYSSRPESWILYVHEFDRSKISHSLQSYVTDPAPLSDWCPVKLDRWSLAETHSPMYPEDRFQLAVIDNFLSRQPDTIRFRIEISSPQIPFWWRRKSRVISTREEISNEQSCFLLGAKATW